MDLMFAISSLYSANFQIMKQTINEIIERLSMNQTSYSVLVFGASTYKRLDFGTSFSDKQTLKDFIMALSNTPGKPALAKALDEATRTFDGSSRGSGVANVLVVIMDSNSSVPEAVLRTKTEQLQGRKVKVVSVALGNRASPAQLGAIVKHKDNLVVIRGMEHPASMASDIINAILRSK